jgi:hypothetical protein
MSQMSSALLLLAASTLPSDTDAASLRLMPAALRDAVEAKQADAKGQALDDAAESVMALISKMTDYKRGTLVEIRQYRQYIAQEKGRLDEIDRAFAYGNATSNYMPLMIALGMSTATSGMMTSADRERLSVIPDGWTPPADVPAAPTAG